MTSSSRPFCLGLQGVPTQLEQGAPKGSLGKGVEAGRTDGAPGGPEASTGHLCASEAASRS